MLFPIMEPDIVHTALIDSINEILARMEEVKKLYAKDPDKDRTIANKMQNEIESWHRGKGKLNSKF